MKKFIIFLSICIIGMFNIQPAIYVKADSGENVEIKINQSISDQLDNLDLSNLEDCLNDLSQFYNLDNTISLNVLVSCTVPYFEQLVFLFLRIEYNKSNALDSPYMLSFSSSSLTS